MFARTVIKRYHSMAAAPTAENFSGCSGSNTMNAIAFACGLGFFPAMMIYLNQYPSTRRITSIPTYNGTELYANSTKKH